MMAKLLYIIALLVLLDATRAQFNLILNRYSLNKTQQHQQLTTKLYRKQPIVVKFLNQTISGKNANNYYKCPSECICQGLSIDCSNRRLIKVPINIPYNVIKVELQGNKLISIKNEDLSYLKNLKVLHLQDNQIEFIEENSFENLISLERLRLNNNKLTYLENGLFANLKSLKRLDLSFNKIKSISKELFSYLANLNNLQIDNNELRCLEKGSLDSLIKLDIFRIQNNKLECSCKTLWIAEWLKEHTHLAHDTKCYTYDKYKEYDMINLKSNDFGCDTAQSVDTHCEAELLCPYTCACENNIVDCKEKSLTQIPNSMLADSAVELHLKKNLITEIPSEAFARLKQLRLLDLSNNQIQTLHSDSFKGLKSLNTLILFRNEIKHLPPLFLSDSPNVQFLLLNANKLTCLNKDVFIGLSNLNLLSLFDNQLKSIPNGILEPLTSIQTIHLGRNPFVCDCKLKWLNEYFRSRPVERSGITCSQPKRLAKKNIGTIPSSKFRCHTPGFTNHSLTLQIDDDLCLFTSECPSQCICSGTIVDCKGKNLTEIPINLPELTTEIHLQDNDIKEIKANGLFKRLKHLQRLDLRNNNIENIEDNAFEGAQSLIDLFLNDNNLEHLKSEAFFGLKSLKTLLLRSNKIIFIKNTTFDNLSSLRLLSLFDNKIKCIQPGSFDKLKSLSTLNIMSNPINCNCKIKWLKEWLRTSSVATGNPKCTTPDKLKDQLITSIDNKELECQSNDRECGLDVNTSIAVKSNGSIMLSQLTMSSCPKNCTCSNSIVRCSHLNLKKIPDDINLNVRELYLDSNDISDISPSIKKFTNLIKLDLSFNKIRVLPSKIFDTLYNLDTLILSFNNIQCIQVDSFLGLKKLRMLSLYGNDISTLTDGTFSDMSSLSHVALGLNPFYCDCNLAWLSAWIKNDYVEPGIARCQAPSRLANKLLLTTPIYYFECKNDSTTLSENKCDLCYKNACSNNSTCIAKPELNSYQCVCAPGYHGEKCDQPIDACYGQPCKNQGLCKVLMEGRYKCECKKGWEGYHCDTNIDECSTNSCQNNATCIDKIGYYECQCPKGFEGNNCDKKIEWCSRPEYNLCLNNAKCIKLNNGYKCECQPGFTGENCATNIDDCNDHKCQFGICVDGVQNYTCKCKDGFSGQYCDIMNPIAMPLIGNQKQSIQRIEHAIGCETNNCQNGGICYKLAYNGQLESKTRCKCPLGYSGDQCQRLNIVNLQYEDSYLELESPELDSHFNITFTFITDAENGVLFYHGSKAKHHMAVELFKGRIKVSFDVGNTPSSTMFSYAKVNDKKEHTVEFIISGQNFTMKLNDSNEQRTISNQGLKLYLNVVDEPLYLGGVPNSIKDRISKHLSHVRNASSLRGCISNLYINSEWKDLDKTEYNHKIQHGCTHLEACNLNENKKCFNGGVCKTIFSLNSDFSCECSKDFTGSTCELPVSRGSVQHRAEPLMSNYNSNGQKSAFLLKSDDLITVSASSQRPQVSQCSHRIQHDYYTDLKTGCKSKKKIRMIKCTGTCRTTNENTINNNSDKQNQLSQYSFLIGTNRKSNQRSINAQLIGTPAVSCCQPVKLKPKRIKLFCQDGSTILTDIQLTKKCICSSSQSNTKCNNESF